MGTSRSAHTHQVSRFLSSNALENALQARQVWARELVGIGDRAMMLRRISALSNGSRRGARVAAKTSGAALFNVDESDRTLLGNLLISSC